MDAMKKMIISICFMMSIFTCAACSNANVSTPSSAETGTTEKQPVQAFGTVKVLHMKDISFDFPVKIKTLLVKDGQTITGGEALAVIDTSVMSAEIQTISDQAEALQAETTNQQIMFIQKKELFHKSLNPELLRLENGLKKAQAIYEGLLTEFAEKEAFLESGILSQKEYHDYATQVDLGQYACEDADLLLKSYKAALQNELILEEAAINRNLRKISELNKELQKSKSKLTMDYLKEDKIISSIPKGIVCGVECSPGETVPIGKKLFSIMDTDSLVIEANVDEQFIKDVKLGARAYIIPEWDRSQEYKGKVTFLSAYAIQQNSETVIPVQISLDENDNGLLPGFNTEIEIEAE